MWRSILRFLAHIDLTWCIFFESFIFLFVIAADQAVAIETSGLPGTV